MWKSIVTVGVATATGGTVRTTTAHALGTATICQAGGHTMKVTPETLMDNALLSPRDPCTSMLESSMRVLCARQNALFVEYAEYKGLPILELLKDVTEVRVQGSKTSTFMYKGEPFLIMSEPTLVHVPQGIKLVAPYKKI